MCNMAIIKSVTKATAQLIWKMVGEETKSIFSPIQQYNTNYGICILHMFDFCLYNLLSYIKLFLGVENQC